MTTPILQTHSGIRVVRDDPFPGGTEGRFVGKVFDGVQEAVCAIPPGGGAQTAQAHFARALDKTATIFAAIRAKPHARRLDAAGLANDPRPHEAPAMPPRCRHRRKAVRATDLARRPRADGSNRA